ncbi:GNAT family N-acetyltransferase [Candidatus Leptofilum sp.]|uniref:GNAT family N-acetyltransferase n=1 Tax=Candidatus Leptofilum sp. TaxID=3241576 RepID=UPI003B5CD2AD
MRVITFRNATEFLKTALPYLEAYEVLNGLMLGIAFRLSQSPPRRRTRPFLALVEGDGKLVGAALMTPPRKMVLYSHLDDCQPVVEALGKALVGTCWTVPAVLGPANVADSWAKMWERGNNRPPKPGMMQRVFELRQVQPLKLPSGKLRLAAADDFERTVAWIQGFHKDANIQDDLEAVELLARGKIQNGDLFLWENEAGEPVTMAAKARPTRHGITVTLVYTPAELRGRGYATACVATLSQQLLDEGYQFCTLFTDLSNPVSNHIYEKIGYTAVADFHEYFF